MRPVVVLPEAEQDLAEAFRWYEEQRPRLGGAFLDEVALLFTRISDFPLASRPSKVRFAELS